METIKITIENLEQLLERAKRDRDYDKGTGVIHFNPKPKDGWKVCQPCAYAECNGNNYTHYLMNE